MRKCVAIYCLLVGLSIVSLWTGLLIGGEVPELQSDPVGIATHLIAESMTALALVSAGLAMLKDWRWSASLRHLALGLLLYSTVSSLGYYLGRPGGEPFVALFLLLISATLLILLAGREKLRV